MEWKCYSWAELTRNTLYKVMALRAAVFVVEQNCVYQDLDGKDEKAHHLLGFQDNSLVAYARLFKSGDYFKEKSFGRAVVKESHRKSGIGHQLVIESLKALDQLEKGGEVKISAQAHLENFYAQHGFKTQGAPYLEDNIPHLAMYRSS